MTKRISKRKKKWIERTVNNDRRYKLALYNRFYLYALFVLLQLAGWGVFLYLLTYNSGVAFAMQVATGVLALLSVLYILNKEGGGSAKMSWILVILIAPVFGVPLYLTCAEGRPTRHMKRKIDKTKAQITQAAKEVLGESQPFVPMSRAEGCSYSLANAGYPIYKEGEVTYYESGADMFPDMKKALLSAEKFILVEYFIIAHGKMWNEMLKILLEKAEEGVQVRILYDDFGCMTTLPPDYDRYLESLHKNVRALAFNNVIPVFTVRMNNRDHRKLLVVDGKVGFTGGVNLADEYIGEKRRFGHWKDSGVRIVGGAVNSFTQMFFGLWNAFRKDKEDVKQYLIPCVNKDMVPSKAGEEFVIQPYDDSPLDGISVGELVYLDMIDRAEKSLYVFTPYLILDDLMRGALCRAALRGVDVRIVTPAIPDKKTVYRLTRANYGILMKAGVKIYEYTPGFIHAKSMVCDEKYAVVGTINLDYRSLYLHFENAVYFTGCPAVDALVQDCIDTCAISKFCTKENTRRGLLGRLFDAVLRVFETLL